MAREAAVFLNSAEFARETELNGVKLTAVVSGPHSQLSDQGDSRAGVILETAVLNYPAGLLPLPKADREIIWQGQKWMVLHSFDHQGIHRLEIYRERS